MRSSYISIAAGAYRDGGPTTAKSPLTTSVYWYVVKSSEIGVGTTPLFVRIDRRVRMPPAVVGTIA